MLEFLQYETKTARINISVILSLSTFRRPVIDPSIYRGFSRGGNGHESTSFVLSGVDVGMGVRWWRWCRLVISRYKRNETSI